jgi:ABC-2 type transport system ATP-binding protein
VRSAIRTEGLTKRYGDTVAVDHLDLAVEEGEVFGLLGPNGAGKTTTILMLLGLSEPTEGRAEVLGLDPQREALAVKRLVGYVPDAVGFYDDLTGRQNLRYTARLNRIPPPDAEARIDEVLDEVGLAARADDPVGAYSRGMRQRLGLADALLKQPRVLILDEPTVAIDPIGVEEMLDVIRRMPDRGVTVLLSSHLLEQVQSVCDRIGIFVAGRLAAQGTISELAAAHGGRFTVELRTAQGDGADVVRGIPGVLGVHDEAGMLVVDATRDIRADIGRALAERGLWVEHLTVRSEQLDVIYRRYFTEAEDGDGRAA